MREKHGIQIEGSTDKKNLINMGYYHGFKGYRFIGTSSQQIKFNNFGQLQSLYNFDMKLKTIFYPHIMLLETSIKNYTLEVIIENGEPDFDYVFSHHLNDYKSENTGNSKYRDKMKSRLILRNHIYEAVSYSYSNKKPVIQHFFHKNENIPLWAIFEVISLGNFGVFLRCLNFDMRINVARKLGVHTTSHNHNGRLIESIIFILKDLRNAIAHNAVIFDCRFKGNEAASDLKTFLEHETGVPNIQFNSIVDYLILVVYLRKKLGATKTELKLLIRQFSEAVEELRSNNLSSIQFAILGSDSRKKIEKLRKFI